MGRRAPPGGAGGVKAAEGPVFGRTRLPCQALDVAMSAEPPAKRLKQDMAASPWPKRLPKSPLGAWSDTPPHPLRATWLLSSPLALPDGRPSPAALQGCRVALQVGVHGERPTHAPDG